MIIEGVVPKVEALRTPESLLLDVVRVTASIIVVFGHLTEPLIQVGWSYSIGIARGAVTVFFILSGFVIRHVTCRRPGTLGSFVTDRLSRIYSVVIPALLVTAIADRVSVQSNSTLYGLFNHHLPYRLGQGFLANLFFCAQIWGHGTNPMSNSPFWSINYEVAYYGIYAAAFYLEGWKRVCAVLAICLFAGPKILFLFPLWVAGCVSHDLYQRWGTSRGVLAGVVKWAVRVLCALCVVLLPTLLAGRLLLSHYPAAAKDIFSSFHKYFLDRITVGNYAFGLAAAVLFLPLLRLVRGYNIEKDSGLARGLHFVAEGTFPIYLLHYPLLVLAACAIPYDHGSSLQKMLILTCIALLGIAAGHPLNLLKLCMRALGNRVESRLQVSSGN